jgi:hypothetical protein
VVDLRVRLCALCVRLAGCMSRVCVSGRRVQGLVVSQASPHASLLHSSEGRGPDMDVRGCQFLLTSTSVTLPSSAERFNSSTSVHLLSVPLTIPLVYCHSKHFRRTARCGEAMAGGAKRSSGAGRASRGRCSEGVVAPPVWCHRGVPARGVVPERCHASGAAVALCSAVPAWAPWAECAADGGVVSVARALAGSLRAPRITAQRRARCAP